MPTFCLIGAAGYIAPKHMQAIKDVGGNLVAALDPHDSVGVLDRYFPQCRFFTEFERFDRYCDKFIHAGERIDYVSIASPNYLHDSHSRFALRIGADAIVEKPLVLNYRNLLALKQFEKECSGKVHTVLQLRYHPVVKELKEKYTGKRNEVYVSYHTPRGNWYGQTWKSEQAKSGGLITNIGVHLFDTLSWIFGAMVDRPYIHGKTATDVSGIIDLERARVYWDLSIDMGKKPRRTIAVDSNEYDLSGGFTDLHTEVYRQILAGNSYGIDDAAESIKIVEMIRGMNANS